MSKRLVNLKGGEFFAIPLFLSDRSDLDRFKKSDFIGNDKKFVFCRIISDQQGGGFL
ncbi:hypothetical protein RYD26_12330 [Pasteurellaceae bacterium LIM206]|nr:hypothetical protein [Pasteurellaceae bacterium LIM206]